MFLGNSCTDSKTRSTPSPSYLASGRGGPWESYGNGRSYDGKLVRYQSRRTVSCDASNPPAVIIENDTDLDTFRVITTTTQANGYCATSERDATGEVDAFATSHLAGFSGHLHDKVLDLDELALDNSRTRIVCKLNLGPLLLLDNQWMGAVVMETPDPKIWDSRLDFAMRSPKSEFLFDRPPRGFLVQTASALEFRTHPEAIALNPGIYQLMYLKIQRPYSDALSPSLNYGRKVYPGKIDFIYFDYTQAVVSGVSIASSPVTCFADVIALDRMQAAANIEDPYDFMAILTATMKK